MRYFKFEKLVRDKILPQMQQNQHVVRGVKKLNDSEFINELIKKILEEAHEMANVSSKEDLKNELADVYETLDYLKTALSISNEELELKKKQKSDKNGGFNDRIYIVDVGVDEDNQWIKYYCDNPKKYPEVK
jgi:predicted house-cleaning noncanonical NTP pyrophosphatase (MazG superfamily)